MISSITNIQTYVIGYTSQQVELEMDITTNRYFLSKILGNNLYLNDFDKFIYIIVLMIINNKFTVNMR